MKFCIVTSTRAEYGLLLPLIKRLIADPDIDMDLIVSGTHLLERFGKTEKFIIADGLPIRYRLSIMKEDFLGSEKEVTHAIAAALDGCSDIFSKEYYDALIVLGDRYEMIGFCTAAMMFRIPIVHIHGGEVTEGAIDEKIRHAITKMASVHFPSIQEYAERILQLGENPKYVFPVGALGIDNIIHLPLLEKVDLFEQIGVETNKPIAVVTYHPVTSLARENAIKEIETVMQALYETGVFSIITMPNSDVGGTEIFLVIDKYAERYPDSFVIRKSLGQIRYLSLLKHADIMVGNSSSGILESASFCLPTINIGDRQKGRMAPKNVINCPCNYDGLKTAIQRGLSKPFRKSLNGYINPYGDGTTSEKMVAILKKINWSSQDLIQKHFYDR